MWHLKNGQFFELNAGTRISNSMFGFGAALGYLTIKRDIPKWESNSLNRKMIYDSLIPGSGTHPVITTGLDENSIKYTKPDITEQYHKNFRGIYLLAGPEIWLGCCSSLLVRSEPTRGRFATENDPGKHADCQRAI